MTQREMQAALAWSSLPFVGERSLQGLLDHAREGRRSLADLWEAPLPDLRRIIRLHPRTVAALQEDAPALWSRAAADAEALRAWGADLLLAGDPEYPPALRSAERRWPLVFAYGALGLLEEPRAALLNSSTVSNSGLAATDSLADALARRDVALVTSTSRDSYKAAAIAAKRHAGPAVMVLDRGIADMFPSGVDREPVAPSRVWDESFDPELQLLLAPFTWRERWNPRSGPRRDALIADLAEVLVAVDIRSGGNIDRECRAAQRRGKRVLALDRGTDTVDGTRRLWEQETNVTRVPWTDAERVAAAVLKALPGGGAPAGGERHRQGWQREAGQFLARACLLLDRRPDPRLRSASAYPTSGGLAPIAAAWSSHGADTTAGCSWLLADLVGEGAHPPARLGQLMDRVAPGGFLAALVPAAWLEGEEFAGARSQWLGRTGLRLTVRLPQWPSGGETAGATAAAVVLERSSPPGARALAFAPERERMGRFHLRRYLQEVLAALPAAR